MRAKGIKDLKTNLYFAVNDDDSYEWVSRKSNAWFTTSIHAWIMAAHALLKNGYITEGTYRDEN